MYAYTYIRMTKAQAANLKVPNRKAVRVINRLPASVKIEDLQTLTQINALKKVTEERKASLLVRLQGSESGLDVFELSNRKQRHPSFWSNRSHLGRKHN